MKAFWQRQTVFRKLALLCLASAVIMAGAEVAFNFHALTTSGLTPTELSPDYFTCDDETAVCDDAGIHLRMGAADTVEIHHDMIYEPVRTVHIALEGEGTVQAAVMLMDESFAYLKYQLYSGHCVADDPVLQNLYAVANSCGIVYELFIEFSDASNDADITVRSITINAPIPFRLQPLRMALVFIAALALLCALLLRGYDTAYNPQRPLHRSVILLSIVGMMIFAVLLVSWKYPDRPVFAGLPREEALQTNDIYAALLDMLLENRVVLEEEPSEALLNLANPYDPTERAFFYGTFKYDYVLFEDQYYIYFGLAPILSVYAPYYALTGQFPTSSASILMMGLLAILLVGWAVCGMANRYAKGANVFALALCVITVVFVCGIYPLIMAEIFYHLPIMAWIAFSAGAIGFGVHAAEQKRVWLKLVQYALSGLCFGLAVMTRTNALPMLAALLIPLFLFELLQKRADFKHAIAFLLPAALGIGLVFWYNKARFGSILDFGYTNQLTALDSHYQHLVPADFSHAIYHFFFTPVSLTCEFPYVSSHWDAIRTFGQYKFLSRSVGILVFPVTWGIALMRLSRPPDDRGKLSLAAQRRWVYLSAALAGVLVAWMSYCLAGVVMRYIYDYLFYFSLIGALCMLPVMSSPKTPERRALCAICVLLCLASIFISVGLVFLDGSQIRTQSPQVYYTLQRMFYPY